MSFTPVEQAKNRNSRPFTSDERVKIIKGYRAGFCEAKCLPLEVIIKKILERSVPTIVFETVKAVVGDDDNISFLLAFNACYDVAAGKVRTDAEIVIGS